MLSNGNHFILFNLSNDLSRNSSHPLHLLGLGYIQNMFLPLHSIVHILCFFIISCLYDGSTVFLKAFILFISKLKIYYMAVYYFYLFLLNLYFHYVVNLFLLVHLNLKNISVHLYTYLYLCVYVHVFYLAIFFINGLEY